MPEIASVLAGSANMPDDLVETEEAFRAFESADSGLRFQEEQLAEDASEGRRRFLVWCAPQTLIVGPTESRLPNFAVAANYLRSEGWPVIRRHSGGKACPVSAGTLQLAISQPVVPGTTIETAYQELAGLVCAVVRSYGLTPAVGTIPDSFCPGRFDISISGRKVAGLSQRWQQRKGCMTVTTASTLIVDGCVRNLVRVVNLFDSLLGRRNFCSESAVCSLRQHLPGMFVDSGLLYDVSHRLVREWSMASNRQDSGSPDAALPVSAVQSAAVLR